MYYIGIDIGKNHHEASIVDQSGNQVCKSLRFPSNHKGAVKLLEYIHINTKSNDLVFGLEATVHYWYTIYSFLKEHKYTIYVLEATVHYWYTIYSFLKEHKYTIYVINPIQSDCFRNFYIRQIKNDSKDSFLIAEVIRFGRFTTTDLADEDILSLRQLCRYRESISDRFLILSYY